MQKRFAKFKKKWSLEPQNQAMEYMDKHADEYADVLNQIGNAAFKASQESKKLSDSIIATMDAVSSGWLRTYEIIFGELDEARANFYSID